MTEQELLKIMAGFSQDLPHFPDGRIDYSTSNTAAVVTVFVQYGDHILLLKRGDQVRTYRGKWYTVAGYLDELKPVREKVLAELREEVGIGEEDIATLRIAAPQEITDSAIHKTWLFCPVLAVLKRKPEIRLDWEHTEARWIKPEEMSAFDTVPHTEECLQSAID